MKNQILSLCLIAVTVTTYAQSQKEIVTEIKNVTVYQQGAQISREGNVSITKGKTTLLFKGLPSRIRPESIQARATSEVMIVSVKHSLDYLNKTIVNKEITTLTNRRRILLDSIKMLNNYKIVYSQEKEMILANKSIAGDNGVNINELEQAATFFRKRLTEIESTSHKLDNNLFNLKTDLVTVSQQLMELNAKVDLPTSLVSVVVSSDVETKSNIQLNYFIEDASWVPAYDIRIKDVNTSLNLFYKAKVSQNTDENWENVKLTLSTGNPSISNNKPDLSAYYLTFNNYYNNRPGIQYGSTQQFKGHVSGRITDAETGEALVGTNIVIKGTSTGAIADINGNYQIDLPKDANTLVFSFIGYGSQEVTVKSANMDIKLTPDMLSLNEVVVTAYGVKRDDSDSDSEDRVGSANPVRKKEVIPLAIEKRQLTTEFQINIPYSIPSDNQQYDVTMVQYDIDAIYNYSTVPKLSNDAFLIARIPDYVKYNLLNGTAYIFFKGIYQGESFIDLDTPGDTLTLSVGRDRDIVVSREIQKDFATKSITGNTKKEQKAWAITLKNNKITPINISIEDQFPVSKTDEIKVDLIEDSGAKIDKSTGKLLWDIKMGPNEKKIISLRYSVKYPNGKPVIIE
jgi:hypothetical protein